VSFRIPGSVAKDSPPNSRSRLRHPPSPCRRKHGSAGLGSGSRAVRAPPFPPRDACLSSTPRDVVEELPTSGTSPPTRLGAGRTIGGPAVPPPRMSQEPAGASPNTAFCSRRRETLGGNRNGELRFGACRRRRARQAAGAARVRLLLGGVDDKRPDPGMVDLRVDPGEARPRAPGTEAHDPDLHVGGARFEQRPAAVALAGVYALCACGDQIGFEKYHREP
jgi:hypothetical protein